MSTRLTRRAFRYWLVAIIFLIWNQKRKIRSWVKYGSLGILSFSTVLLLIEILGELLGRSAMLTIMITVGPEIERIGPYISAAFIAATIAIVVIHYKEAKEPQFEYAFVLRLWEFMENRRHPVGQEYPVREVLRVFHNIFDRIGIEHVSIYRLNRDGKLRIDPGEVYPEEHDGSFYVDLAPGEGVAGLVYKDMKARYMPWLSLVRSSFPHAINFEWNQATESTGMRPIDLSDLDFELDVYKPPATGKRKYRSFLSVPLNSVRKQQCVGVLNLDFSKLDPLEKSDIAMAMVIGLILADEI